MISATTLFFLIESIRHGLGSGDNAPPLVTIGDERVAEPFVRRSIFADGFS